MEDDKKFKRYVEFRLEFFEGMKKALKKEVDKPPPSLPELYGEYYIRKLAGLRGDES